MSAHRHRTRPRPAELDDVDDVALAADELEVLWPQLVAALARDSAGLGGGERRGGTNVHASVINLEVQHVMVSIAAGASELEAEAERLLRLDRANRDVTTVLGHLVEWRDSLAARGLPLATHIGADVLRWHRAARAALNLDTRTRPLGHLCPDHRDTDPTELLVDPDRAELHRALLRGERPADGEASLTWRYAEAVHCPKCKRRWSGVTELRWLGKLLASPVVAAS